MFGWNLRVGAGGPLARSNPVPDFAIADLFLAGEQGVLYDPSDLTTLFQDAAGTTPVTAAGQPVGRMLDKSGRGNHATQPTAGFRPIFRDVGGLRYLQFDGVDDCLFTGSIDFTSTDKMSVFVGAQKLIELSQASILELSQNVATFTGSFQIRGTHNNGSNYSFAAYGSGAAISQGTYPAPAPVVISCRADKASDTASISVNRGPTVTTTGDQGTGNFGNYPLFIGRRNNAVFPYNGNLYGLIVRGALTDAATTAKIEDLLAAKAGVAL